MPDPITFDAIAAAGMVMYAVANAILLLFTVRFGTKILYGEDTLSDALVGGLVAIPMTLMDAIAVFAWFVAGRDEDTPMPVWAVAVSVLLVMVYWTFFMLDDRITKNRNAAKNQEVERKTAALVANGLARMVTYDEYVAMHDAEPGKYPLDAMAFAAAFRTGKSNLVMSASDLRRLAAVSPPFPRCDQFDMLAEELGKAGFDAGFVYEARSRMLGEDGGVSFRERQFRQLVAEGKATP